MMTPDILPARVKITRFGLVGYEAAVDEYGSAASRLQQRHRFTQSGKQLPALRRETQSCRDLSPGCRVHTRWQFAGRIKGRNHLNNNIVVLKKGQASPQL
jgi:hypothetical protein